ncbi:MAG: enoyl-CoA hydratase/isomerase family protein [Xylophilus ampelinus]
MTAHPPPATAPSGASDRTPPNAPTTGAAQPPDAADPAPIVLLDEIPAAAGGARFAVATLNAPRTLNAVSLAMVHALDGALQEWAQDPGIAGVLLQGGEKAFCAGGDLLQIHRSIRDADGGPNPHAAVFFEQEYRLDHRIHAYPKPVLAWGHGIAMGGGIGLLAGASHRVATEASRWAMPEIGIGLFPDVGGSWFLRRMPGRAGLFLALTGAPLDASDARFAGLADFRIAQAQKDDVLDAIAATRWRGGDARADRAELSRLLHRHQAPPDDRDAWPPSRLRGHFDTIEALMAGEDLRDIAGRLRALESGDPWLAAAAANFARGSPTAAALAFALWQRVPRLSLAEVFRLEYHAALACCAGYDFPEGIRALLVDKDRAPRWDPPALEQVAPGLVEAHLRPRGAGPHPLDDLRD